MDSIDEAKVMGFLRYRLNYDPYEVGTIIYNMRDLARMAGHALDHRFGGAGLGAGPEARIACGIVELALGGGGCETSMYTIRQEIARWLRTTPPKGMIA
ncbi:MAG: hypothetical protein KAV82_14070 [Phycisphaerae bacterium]|nr:hypothetical protein [Phycisphaerae bacterium]